MATPPADDPPASTRTSRALATRTVQTEPPLPLGSIPPNSGTRVRRDEGRVGAAPSGPPFAPLVLLFALSGAAGLVDQVCFSKYLSYVVGATAYAVSAVLAAFMTGLALGAHLGGRLSARVTRPLRAYGAAELVVGVAVALAPWAFEVLTPLYIGLARSAQHSLGLLSALRWLVAVSLVIVPTTAMGMTLPLVAPWIRQAHGGSLADPRTRERRLGVLYAANTLGGALGALAAAYLVLPVFGIAGTLRLSAAISSLVGLASLFLARRSAALPSGPDPVAAELIEATAPSAPLTGRQRSEGAIATTPGARGAPLRAATPAAPGALRAADTTLRLDALAVLSGALVFMAEVVATHLLAVIIGNSAYAFGLILAVFLLCLFAGALLAPWARRRFDHAALGMSLALTAVACALTLPLWDDLPLAFGRVGEYVTSFAGREAVRAAVAFLILCLPATLMGLTFPLLLAHVAARSEVGKLVGRLTALNTLGAVLGALGTGYWILPRLGSQGSLALIAGAFAMAALAEARTLTAPRRRALSLVATAAIAVAVLQPAWRPEKLTAGNNVYFDAHESPATLLMMREDVHGGITTVTLRNGVRTLYTNGKFQGNSGWEINAQRYFAHYPCLFVERFDRALVIGLGTGTTLGTLTTYPWRRLDVVEISPSIALAAERFFGEPNRGALRDPRVALHHEDGRNYLLVGTDRYDLISMELSSVWFAGASSLYSREYYRLVRDHLRPRGIFQQWVQLHHIYPPVFAAMLHTLRLEFEHVALFYGGGQGILVASREPLRWSTSRAERLGAGPALAGTLANHRPLTDLLRDILVLDAGLDRFLEDAARNAGQPLAELFSSDDNLRLEYETPRGNVLPWAAREQLVATLRRYREPAVIDGLAQP